MTVPIKHPAIFAGTEQFDFRNAPTDPIELAQLLVKKMIDNNGLGLAAPQLGLPYRVFAMLGEPNIVCFNPRIVDNSDDKVELEEGCLSYPGVVLKVNRPVSIRVRYAEPNSNVVTKTFSGMTARCFMHELDHLNGIAFTDRVSKLKRDIALRKAYKRR